MPTDSLQCCQVLLKIMFFVRLWIRITYFVLKFFVGLEKTVTELASGFIRSMKVAKYVLAYN